MRRDHLAILIPIAATALAVTLLAPYTWLVLLTDGLLAAAVLAAAAGWGAWPTAWLGFRNRTSSQQICIASALGLGLLGALTLILGVSGLLNRPLGWILVAVGGVLGLVRLQLAQSTPRRGATDSPAAGASTRDDTGGQAAGGTHAAPGGRALARQGVGHHALYGLMLLVLVVPLAVALFGASLPPGMLWQEEARGYDVLEYHLQGPREYYDAGRITFLTHNVYTSFPQQMEMLYLLLMHLAGGVYVAAIPAQLLHAGCGILALVALGCWTRPGWSRWLVVVLAGSTPWLAHVGCLAYVENGMLFFAAVAAGLVKDHFREEAGVGWRTTLAAGLCAGLAGGCKYTALVFVAIALALAWLVTMRASFRRRIGRVAVFGVGALLAFSPWLVRNAAFTGNPVYPFGYAWLGGRAWSTEQANQWSVGHRVLPEYDSITGRLTLASRELFGSFDKEARAFRPTLFGQVLFVLAAAGILLGWSRRAALLTIWTTLIVLGWIGLTFIPGRFAVPLIVPLAMLAGGAVEPRRGTDGKRSAVWRWPLLLIALAGAVVNDVSLAGRLRDHDRRWKSRTGVPMRQLLGQTDIFASGHLLNETLPADAYAWLVGDAAVFYVERQIHYTVPFSRDAWLDFAATGPGPQECLDWLRARNVSHVVFNWPEIERLRRTYGFSQLVTPDWLAQLEHAGLRRVETEIPRPGAATIEVYEVLPRTGD